jgi:hypothetical protein
MPRDCLHLSVGLVFLLASPLAGQNAGIVDQALSARESARSIRAVGGI